MRRRTGFLARVARAAALALAVTGSYGGPRVASAIDVLEVEQDGKPVRIEGKVLVEAVDGGLLVLDVDGTMWPLQPDEIKSRTTDDRPFTPLTAKSLEERLLLEFPDFRTLRTPHYVIGYRTSQTYAQWCGSLYERLYRGFLNYWKTRGWDLKEPELPLVALIFENRETFTNHARTELGDAASGVIGYYNMRSNRVTMYDLTGVDEFRRNGPRASDAAHIQQILSQPGAERTVATIVHEATHQLAYNCGVQVRYAANPMWVSEGLAVFFESPDHKSDRGWRTVGAVNQVHLANFLQYMATRPENSLLTLLIEDKRFHDPKQIPDAYSEAWGLNHFLANRRRDQYVAYLKRLAEKKPLVEETPQDRLALFKECFGDLRTVDEEFLRYMRKLR